jgi:hypothetical protein
MLWKLAVVFLVIWAVGFVAVRAVSGLYHILLGLAVALFLAHLFRRGKAA